MRDAAKGWRNVVPCTCSVTISMNDAVVDKSHCPRHGEVLTTCRSDGIGCYREDCGWPDQPCMDEGPKTKRRGDE